MRSSRSLLSQQRVCIPLDNAVPCCLHHLQLKGERCILHPDCRLAAAGVVAKLPSVPIGKVAAPAKSPEELKLEAEMAL